MVDARMSLALWLRAGRAERGLTLDDVARVTKIQPRILERLEGGKLDGLPAEVFVRGFIRSFARCCGLDESEALTRYTAASAAQAGIPLPPTSAAPATARAMVEVMADLAPQVARVTPVSPTVLKRAPTQAIEVVDYAERGGADRLAAGSLAIPVAAVEMPAEVAAEVTADASEASEPTEAASADSDSRASRAKKKQRGKKRSKRKSIATGTPWLPTPVVMQAVEPPSDLALAVEASTTIAVEASSTAPANASPSVDVAEAPAHSEAEIEAPVAPVDHLDPLVPAPADNDDIVATEIWQPKIPQAAAAPSV
ncbi:MAG TPA: helix-turn-helix domain-containing protein, partial [Kofleriaceae bacterium]|nr:helix-turn-helix domain-containing protein [Kofleriaceae bacterium]